MMDNESNGIPMVKETAKNRPRLDSKQKLAIHWAKQAISELLREMLAFSNETLCRARVVFK